MNQIEVDALLGRIRELDDHIAALNERFAAIQAEADASERLRMEAVRAAGVLERLLDKKQGRGALWGS